MRGPVVCRYARKWGENGQYCPWTLAKGVGDKTVGKPSTQYWCGSRRPPRSPFRCCSHPGCCTFWKRNGLWTVCRSALNRLVIQLITRINFAALETVWRNRDRLGPPRSPKCCVQHMAAQCTVGLAQGRFTPSVTM